MSHWWVVIGEGVIGSMIPSMVEWVIGEWVIVEWVIGEWVIDE